jgi:hypothetical protein
MAFTRFRDDPCRISKQLQQQTGPGRYMLNVPGNGDKPCFMSDPNIIIQGWGGNLRTNSINLESDLLGMSRKLNRDCLGENQYTKHSAPSQKIEYPTCLDLTTNQSRVTHPAWMVRDLEQVNWYYPPLNPQENTCLPFQNNLSTRILEKDFFVSNAYSPCVSENMALLPPRINAETKR